ncbi:MAG: aspartate aminotransferase family protein [Alphaproteobacteria bacterium]|nr:aspartate aminotransferase family protein [Alphaproteobacteria bacterium]
MSHVLSRNLRVAPPKAVYGEGIHIVDDKGRRYIDACGGAAVSCLGHGDAEVIRAMREQSERLAYVHTSFFTTDAEEDLAAELAGHAPPGLGHAAILSGGSEAVEAALKLARQFALETGQGERGQVIARRQSYHGSTLGALAVGGNMLRREAYAPLLMAVHHIAPCYAYRERRVDEGDEAYGRRVADELEAKIQEIGPTTVLAFVAETVVGATLGAVPPVPGYFKRVREICDRHGVLLILDEVMCGMGRTGTLHACEQEGVVPDILVMAKGLGAGYQPVGAVLAHDRIVDALRAGSGALQHGQTYMGHPVACAAALAVQRAIRERGLVARVRDLGPRLEAALHDRFGNHPHVGDIRGRGFLQAIELVEDRGTKRPFDPAMTLHARVKRLAMADGLLCYPMGGTIDGRYGDHVVLAPPYIATENELAEIVARLGKAVDAAVAEARAPS